MGNEHAHEMDGGGRSGSPRAVPIPSSRAMAVATLARFKKALKEIRLGGAIETPAAQVELCDEALSEVSMQVGTHCAERGEVIRLIKKTQGKLFALLLDERDGDMAEVRGQARTAWGKGTRMELCTVDAARHARVRLGSVGRSMLAAQCTMYVATGRDPFATWIPS